jgi:sec-independent protein translocase protein TatA
MFGGHIWELAIVLGLALIVFGPKRLPEIGGALGKGIREFKQGTAELAEMGTSTSNQTLTPVPVTQPVSTVPTPPSMSSATYESDASPIPAPALHQNAG